VKGLRRSDKTHLFLFVVFAGLYGLYVLGHTHKSSTLVDVAYIGPGAGFAFLGSFLTLVAGFFLSVLSLLFWPFRMLWRAARRRKGFRGARIKRLIFLGLDGLDPELTERFMGEGKLPNLARLRREGSYRRLRTTFPSLSPVAWSTFSTGVSPARHNIFDYLNRNLKSYLPELSSARVGKPRRVLKIGKFRIPLSRPVVELRRKSQPFWKILGDHGVGSTVLRVPITFPPEKFDGRVLAAMCTPDLKGTQGSFAQYTTRIGKATFENGSRYPLKRMGTYYEGAIEGPEDFFVEGGRTLTIPFRLVVDHERRSATLNIQAKSYRLKIKEYSPWIQLVFRSSLGVKVQGIARFLLNEIEPEVSLYLSPINIDPERPALPISHPSYYASYLANLIGPYATVGMAEDTWALNEGVIDEEDFLKQAYLIFEERKAMFLSALKRARRGVVACVFDTSDRIQHMFFRHLERARSGSETAYAGSIEEMYRRMDDLIGEVLPLLDGNTVLFVLSDHGFRAFRRGVNLNSWLHQNGYLSLKDGACESGRYLRNVDWSRTRAYALGLAGIYLNLKGREACGIVEPGVAAEQLSRELAGKLTELEDIECSGKPVRHVYITRSIYQGPYLDAAPDLIVGYNDGYRVSWDAAVGKVTNRVIEENTKAWSGDHCVDPLLVPGILFSNRKIDTEEPGIEDMAPTALTLFGIQPPPWMEGKPVFHFEEGSRAV